LLTWVYNHDFFLNAGGAQRPRLILTATHAQDAGPLVLTSWPMLVVTVLGLAVGFAALKSLALARSRPR
jgi:hypothetical protein